MSDSPEQAPRQASETPRAVWNPLGHLDKDAQEKLAAAGNVAEKLGVLKWMAGQAKARLISGALEKANKAKEEPSSRVGKISAVWKGLTPEGQAEFLRGNTFFRQLLRDSLTPTAWKVPRDLTRFFKRNVLSAKHLDLKDFNDPNEIRLLVATGVLPCKETLAQEVDANAAESLKLLGIAAPVLALIPEAGPALAEGAELVAQLGRTPAEWSAGLLRQVRAEVRTELASQEVPEAQEETHEDVARADGPGGVEPHQAANNNDPFNAAA